MYYGEATLFIGIATLLATVNIAEARAENANVEFSSDMFRLPFLQLEYAYVLC